MMLLQVAGSPLNAGLSELPLPGAGAFCETAFRRLFAAPSISRKSKYSRAGTGALQENAMAEEWNASDLCRILVSAATLLFFGMSFWMIAQGVWDEQVYLVFDILSVWLMILIVFWLLVAEKVAREQHQEP